VSDSHDGVQERRLAELEADAVQREAADALDRKFELWEAIVMSVAVLLTAWTGFQAAKWSGEQADGYSRASANRVESVEAANLADAARTIDVITFTDWLAALGDEGTFADGLVLDSSYQPDAGKYSGFLFERFRPEFKVAVDAWLAQEPLVNPDAADTPFALAEYVLAADAEAARLELAAVADTATAREANDHSDVYVLMAIIFATVLVLAGISSKLDTRRARSLTLGVSVVVLTGATVALVSLPKDF